MSSLVADAVALITGDPFPTFGQLDRAKLPKAVAGATWQAGVTPDNEQFRIFLNAEPLSLCYAANPRQGWARVYELDACGNILEKSWKTLYGRVEQRRTKA